MVTLILVALFFLLAGCTSMIPREKIPPPLTNETFADPVKVVTIPLPAVATTPNEGITYGALTAFLLHNKKDEVSSIIAPQSYYNDNFGYTASLYGAFYPRTDQEWRVNLSKSTTINEDYGVRMRDKTMMDRKLEVNGVAGVFTDGSARFFGFQSESKQSNETNYADSESGFNVSFKHDLGTHFQIGFGERFRHVSIETGAVRSLPFIGNVFNAEEVPGINGFTTHAQRAIFVYSTLDSLTMPTRGLYGKFVFEVSDEALGSTENFHHYEVELKGYFPCSEARYITVVRLAYSQTLGQDVPFLERSILGGENTLRGFGKNRFIDNSYILVNLEERIRVYRWRIFNVNTDIEIAPFFDAGSVMRDITKIRSNNFEFNPGVGIRGVVRPNIVGRIDIGVGREGPAVFVGLGYPF
ncbi:MAG: outer membrane protein assembly factor YaeT [Syntrophorhabdaceae bacterium PtaU1.Bin034]|nr:MAG: outer membrane protein assembly factor YaeT [Syntrophorhabdaceae bacterium PtaU1.Bin034]